ncbi:MAG: hypothetical protein V4719_08755 [Planctomycetota bacterium]
MLDKYWMQHFGNVAPIAHTFRETFRSRWIRFHSLPNSKRYAESVLEQATILRRFNSIVSELVTAGSQLELLTTNWSHSPESGIPDAKLSLLKIPAVAWRSVAMREFDGDSEPWYWHIFRSSVSWPSFTLDEVIRLVADDRIGNVMLFNTSCSWLIHPYDGGMDLILGTSEARDEMATKYQQWRSSRSDGL